uniref:Uncharacterized protein n=2 Tax=Oryza TaxID=4527 RepID=A0A0D3EWC2_9ORYZ
MIARCNELNKGYWRGATVFVQSTTSWSFLGPLTCRRHQKKIDINRIEEFQRNYGGFEPNAAKFMCLVVSDAQYSTHSHLETQALEINLSRIGGKVEEAKRPRASDGPDKDASDLMGFALDHGRR